MVVPAGAEPASTCTVWAYPERVEMAAERDAGVSFDEASTQRIQAHSKLTCSHARHASLSRDSKRSQLLPALQDFRIRVLDVDKFDTTCTLQRECVNFIDKVQQLNDVVKLCVGALDLQVCRGHVFTAASCHLYRLLQSVLSCSPLLCLQAERIEKEKLRAVGMRNKLATLAEVQKRRSGWY